MPDRTAPFRAALLLAPLLAAGCGADPEPALRVGPVGFAAEEVVGVEGAQLAVLADLASVGAAFATGELEPIVAPLAERAAERARLGALPYRLAARELGLHGARLREAYDEAPEWELSVRHVVRLVPDGASEAERSAARRVAEEVAQRARAGEDFAGLAGRFSQEPGAAERGGLLQPGREGSWVDPFWEAARALEPGEVSPVVETEYGYHVLRLEERRPVPFDEAARLPLLRRLVPPERAMAAMEAWVAARPPVVLDPPAVLAARRALREGVATDSLVLARSATGESYTAFDLALAWVALEPDARAGLATADDVTFGRWVEDEVRQAFWAAEAGRLGVEPPAGAREEALREWELRLARTAAALGFRPRMAEPELRATALRALVGTGQEARIARAEIPALRPLLRRVYPVSGSSSPAAGSSSEMRNSESNR